MTDELTKLAAKRCADELNKRNGTDCWEANDFLEACAANSRGNLWRADKERAHHTAEKAKALILELSSGRPDEGGERIIAALDALILTPPVDPLAQALFDEDDLGSMEWAVDLAAKLRKRGVRWELRPTGEA